MFFMGKYLASDDTNPIHSLVFLARGIFGPARNEGGDGILDLLFCNHQNFLIITFCVS